MAKCSKEPVVTIGIDLAKNSVHVFGVDAQGRQVLSKKVSRGKLSAFMVNQPPCLVAMEACGSAHHWARLFRDFGHEVRLIAPQFVKPFVKTSKRPIGCAASRSSGAPRRSTKCVVCCWSTASTSPKGVRR